MMQIRSLLPILVFFIPLAPAIPFGPTFAITASQIYFNTGHIIAWGAKECYFVAHVTRCYSFFFYYLHVCIYCRELYTARRQVTKREIDQMYSSPLRSMSEHHALFSYRPDRVTRTSTYLRRSWAISIIYLLYFLVFRFRCYHLAGDVSSRILPHSKKWSRYLCNAWQLFVEPRSGTFTSSCSIVLFRFAKIRRYERKAALHTRASLAMHRQ